MSEMIDVDRLVVLARHAITPANRAKYEGHSDGRVQGRSVDMPIIYPEGHVQSHALGIALGKFATRHNLQIIEVHASDTVRTRTTRDLALEHVPNLVVAAPSQMLWEHCKGDAKKGGLEGLLRTEAYPTEAVRRRAAEDPDFRHGSLESGGETPNEAGKRWLDGWFLPLIKQAHFRPRTNAEQPLPTMLAFGHNLVTSRGIHWLMHSDTDGLLPPVSDSAYKVKNATALLLAEIDGQWSVLSDPVVPMPADIELAQQYVND